MMSRRSPYFPQEVSAILSPLLKSIEQEYRKGKTAIIGLQGGQGTGKTTLARFLQQQLQKKGYLVITFSIDDFYTSAPARKKLAREYPHNLFYQISRGLPGTHRVHLLKRTLQHLKRGQAVQLPVFDKSRYRGFGDIDKRTIPVTGRQDFIIMEGWCLGMPLVSSQELVRICRKNKIKLRELDPHLQHHKIVFNYLKPYQPLWKFIDYFIMLKPDSVDSHRRWRVQQERAMEKKNGRQGMTNREIARFVRTYLPFTYVCYEKVKADRTLLVNKRHQIYRIK